MKQSEVGNSEEDFRFGLVSHCGAGLFRAAAVERLRMSVSVLFGVWRLVYSHLHPVVTDSHRTCSSEKYHCRVQACLGGPYSFIPHFRRGSLSGFRAFGFE